MWKILAVLIAVAAIDSVMAGGGSNCDQATAAAMARMNTFDPLASASNASCFEDGDAIFAQSKADGLSRRQFAPVLTAAFNVCNAEILEFFAAFETLLAGDIGETVDELKLIRNGAPFSYPNSCVEKIYMHVLGVAHETIQDMANRSNHLLAIY